MLIALKYRIVYVVCGLLLACSGRDDLNGERTEPVGAIHREKGPPDSQNVLTGINILANRPQIVGYNQGTLFIDATSADFLKYIDGGVRDDWHRGVVVDKNPVAVVRGLGAELHFPLDFDPGGVELDAVTIRFRAKSAVPKQLVSVFLNEEKLGDVRMPTADWQEYQVRATRQQLVGGENKLRFYFRSAGVFDGERSAAAFSGFSIGKDSGIALKADGTAVFKGGYHTPDKGKRRMALSAKPGSRLSYYIKIPEFATELKFTLSGLGQGTIAISESSSKRSEWGFEADSSWQLHGVSLAKFRGKMVRLDLLNQELVHWADLRIVLEPSEISDAATRQVPRHIILWSVSSLRSDRLNTVSGASFRRFADKGFFVPYLQASVPSAGGSNASAMLGVFRTRGTVPRNKNNLARLLRAGGYKTALVSGNGFVNDDAGFADGFDLYDNPMRSRRHFGASSLWRTAKRFLKANKQGRTFVYVATSELHLPYIPSASSLDKYWFEPPPFAPAKALQLAAQLETGRRVVTNKERAYIKALYNGAMQDADTAFSTFLKELDSLALVGGVAVIVVGEHGEELWERGKFGHGGSLYEESLQTPFVIRSDGVSDLEVPKRASSVDIAPTVLDLAGLPPMRSAQGLSLLRGRELDERPVFSGIGSSARAVRFGDFKLTLSGSVLTLYDMARDRFERDNIVDTSPIATRCLRNILSLFRAYESRWSTPRWGQPSYPNAAFASDLGM